jgi:hypothetical protein
VGALLPHLLSVLPATAPGVPRSTANAETPAAPFCAGSVRAMTVNSPAWGALVMNRLVPLIT